MSNVEEKLDQLIQLIRHISPFIEWTHNYSVDQIKQLKLLQLGPSKNISFYYKGTIPISFHVPKGYMDHIQSYQLYNEKFWDQETLELLSTFVSGRHVLDIGANVGNHTVFWGCISGAASIKAFEPIPETFAILKENIRINSLGKRVIAYACALGAENGSGDPVSQPHNRMQATVLARKDAKGAVPVRTLDSFKIKKVDFVKIDVECHTLAMLKGAPATLTNCKPVLYVELFPHERKDCQAILEDYGYKPLGSIEEHNYVFIHSERRDDEEGLKKIIQGPWLD